MNWLRPRTLGRFKLFALTMPLMLLVIACTLPSSTVSTGTVEVRVTDAPPRDVSSIVVTVDDIEVHRAGVSEEDEWITVVAEPREFDLVEIQGIEEILGQNEIQIGSYTQLRMDVIDVTVTIDGEQSSATIPSGVLKVVRPFDVEEGVTTVLIVDFDADSSIVITGALEVQFKPVVRLLVGKASEPGLPGPTLFLEITEPLDEDLTTIDIESVVATSTIVVSGITVPDAVVSLNGDEVDVDEEGNFSTEVALEEGPNLIWVIASDFEGNEEQRSLTVIYTP